MCVYVCGACPRAAEATCASDRHGKRKKREKERENEKNSSGEEAELLNKLGRYCVPRTKKRGAFRRHERGGKDRPGRLLKKDPRWRDPPARTPARRRRASPWRGTPNRPPPEIVHGDGGGDDDDGGGGVVVVVVVMIVVVVLATAAVRVCLLVRSQRLETGAIFHRGLVRK